MSVIEFAMLGSVPGPALVAGLVRVDPAELDADGAITWLQQLERARGVLAALEADAYVAAADPAVRVDHYLDDLLGDDTDRHVVVVEDAAREEIAAAVRLSPVTAGRRIESARLLAGPLAETYGALLAGRIGPAHATVIVDAAQRLSTLTCPDGQWDPAFVADCARLQDRVLPVAQRNTPAAARRSANRAVEVIDADGAEARRRQARQQFGVRVIDDVDNVSVLSATMTTPDAHALLSAINALAKDTRLTCPAGSTIGERRIEAVKAFILGADTLDGPDRDAVTAAQVTAHVNVIISLDALTGASSEPATVETGTVSANTVRDLVAACGPRSTIRRLVTDPMTGHLLDVGRSAYQIPDPLRRYVEIRDQYCRFPGCGRKATTCEIDHATAWNDAGETSRANLGPLCKRHHQLKTFTGWQITHTAQDGTCTWSSPRKRRYDRQAQALAETVPKPPPPDHDPPPF